jgi:hypothetical protein
MFADKDSYHMKRAMEGKPFHPEGLLNTAYSKKIAKILDGVTDETEPRIHADPMLHIDNLEGSFAKITDYLHCLRYLQPAANNDAAVGADQQHQRITCWLMDQQGDAHIARHKHSDVPGSTAHFDEVRFINNTFINNTFFVFFLRQYQANL